MKKASRILLGLLLCFAIVPQILAQSILKDGKIPKDLIITLSLSSTIQFASEYDYKITSDGKVYFEYHSRGLPAQPSFLGLLDSKKKKPQLKDKLSKKQLRNIIHEFEKSGFFEMNEYYQGDLTFKESMCVTHADIKGLSISVNGKTKSVAFFLGCGYGEKSPLQSFLNLYSKIEKELQNIKKQKIEKSINQ